MASVHDVAAVIVAHFHVPITTMKLQKLAFFSQVWSYMLLDEEFFAEDFLAYRNGPVCYELFDEHRGDYTVSSWDFGNPSCLTAAQKIVLDAVLSNYGALSGIQLSELTHEPDTPWSRIREERGIRGRQPSDAIIPKPYIQEYARALAVTGSRLTETTSTMTSGTCRTIDLGYRDLPGRKRSERRGEPVAVIHRVHQASDHHRGSGAGLGAVGTFWVWLSDRLGGPDAAGAILDRWSNDNGRRADATDEQFTRCEGIFSPGHRPSTH